MSSMDNLDGFDPDPSKDPLLDSSKVTPKTSSSKIIWIVVFVVIFCTGVGIAVWQGLSKKSKNNPGPDPFPKTPKWIAVGNNYPPPMGTGTCYGNILYSNDGIRWHQNKSGLFFPNSGTGVAYGNEKWVATGGNKAGYGNILHSDEEINWKQSTSLGASFGVQGIGVSYGNGTWVATGNNNTSVLVGGNGSPYGNILYSTDDGITWHQSSSSGVSFAWIGTGVAYGNGTWVAVGGNSPTGAGSVDHYGNILYSTDDGITWHQSSSSGVSFAWFGNGVAYGKDDSGQGLWVAVGNNSSIASGKDPYGNILYSTDDGITWHQSNPSGVSFAYSGNGVAYGKDDSGQGLWVAVGNNFTDPGIGGSGDPRGNILHSSDGKTWHKSSSSGVSFAFNGNGVAYGDGMWVATGNNDSLSTGSGTCYGNILHSSDGKTWHQSSSDYSFFEYLGHDVAFKN